MTKKYLTFFISLFLVFAVTGTGYGQQETKLAKSGLGTAPIKEKQVMEINKNLKNVIEENQRLVSKTQELEEELADLKSNQLATKNKFVDLKNERDRLAKTVEKVRTINRNYSQEIKRLEKTGSSEDQLVLNSDFSSESEEEFLIAQTTTESYKASGAYVMNATSDEVVDREDKTLDLLSHIDAFIEEDERLRMDSAKAHYNMGNIYYQKGEYEIAAREFYQAVTLMPSDPDSHYNLALVSGDNLKDYETALKHYRMYLYLNPDAADAPAVQEKIVEADLFLRSKVDSPLDKK